MQCTLQLSLQGKISLAKKKKKSVSKRFDLVSLYLRLFLGHFRRLFRVADFFFGYTFGVTLLDVDLVLVTLAAAPTKKSKNAGMSRPVLLSILARVFLNSSRLSSKRQ